MIKYFTVFFISLIQIPWLHGQSKFQPLQFETATPIWTRVNVPEELGVITGCWLEQAVSSDHLYIKDGILYNINTVFISDIDGYYLQAIDLNTGNLLWDHTYIGDTLARKDRIYGQHLSFRGDSIDLTFFKEDNSSPLRIWTLGSLHKASYHIHTGIPSNINTALKPESRSFPIPLNWFSHAIRSYLYTDTQNLKLIINVYFQDSTGNGRLELRNYRIGPYSEVIDSNIQFLKFDGLPDLCYLYDINPEIIGGFVSNSYKKSGKDYIDANLITLDHNLNLLSGCKLTTDSLDIQFNYLYSATETNLITLASNQNKEYYKVHKAIFDYDYQGQIQEIIDLGPLELDKYYKEQTDICPVSISLDGKHRVLFSVFSRRQGNYNLSIYLSDGNGNFRKLFDDRMLVKNKSAIGLYKSAIHENKILLYFHAIETNTGFPTDPNCSHWVVFSLKDLLSHTEEYSDAEARLEVIPNPHHDYFKLEIEDSYNGRVEIIDLQGKIVKTLNRLADDQLVHTSELPTGVYWLKFVSSNTFLTKKIVKTSSR